MFQFVSSIEVLITDAQNIASSEMSARQLTAMVEEELRDRQESHHMEKKAHHNDRSGKSSLHDITMATVYSMLKLTIVFMFFASLGFVILPKPTLSTMSTISSSLSSSLPSTKTNPKYNLANTNWFFFSLQYFRLASTSIKLEKIFSAANANSKGCIINNPLVLETIDCVFCKDVKDFTSLSNDDGKAPLLIMDQKIRFGLGRFQQILNKQSLMMNEHTISITTNCDYIKTVKDLRSNHVMEKLENDKTAHVFGACLSYMSSHILRNEFPRPQDFMSHVISQSFSNIYIDGEKSSAFPLNNLPGEEESYFMYIQCLGSRHLIFSPKIECHTSCQSISRFVKAGEIVIFSSYWEVESQPYGKGMSIAFLDLFELTLSKEAADPLGTDIQ